MPTPRALRPILILLGILPGLCLAAPGLIMFVVLFFGREMFRPRWRGYWDAV